VSQILIAAASFDEHAYGPVRELLEKRGRSVIVYRTDKLLEATERFSLAVTDGAVRRLEYEGFDLLDGKVGAAWYRKVGSFTLSDADTQLSKQLYMNNEVRVLHDSFWPLLFSEETWISSPEALLRADRKLLQLRIAHEVGFRVPKTVVSSDWDSVKRTFFEESNEAHVVVKMVRGVISHNDDVRAVWSSVLSEADVERLQSASSPFPALFQPFIPKAREWRVTIVGDRVFPVAIYTDESAKDDWRKHQNTTAVRFRAEPIPESVSYSCLRYLEELDLGFGAFDLIETPDGEFVFLECNPNGQYGWIEEDLGLPISESIASHLIGMAALRE
jgi:glutathione synthase/RimK-type ligase-like ATP-grasp enzyme